MKNHTKKVTLAELPEIYMYIEIIYIYIYIIHVHERGKIPNRCLEDKSLQVLMRVPSLQPKIRNCAKGWCQKRKKEKQRNVKKHTLKEMVDI